MAKKILIVEDDPTSIAMVKHGLEKEGYEVILARDGDVGLVKAEAEMPDLIILDVEMPRMNGYTFMNEFHKNDKINTIPVIILTTHDEMEPIFKTKGVKGYLIKPADFKTLKEMIVKNITGTKG